MTGEFYGEVMARIKSLWIAMLFRVLMFADQCMIKNRDGGSLDSISWKMPEACLVRLRSQKHIE
jgi:hypothetical protein